MEHPEQVEMAGGAAASSKVSPLHLIPTVALEKTAARFALGIERKGKKSWNALSDNQHVLTNREFLLERCSHIMLHTARLRDKIHAGDVEGLVADDDASAVVWGGMFLQCAVDAMLKEAPSDLDVVLEKEEPKPPDPHWESVPAYEPGDSRGQKVPIGYQVRWSEPDGLGRYLWVGHYFADEHGKNLSLAWCKHAAESDAKRKNEEKRCPWEYSAWR